MTMIRVLLVSAALGTTPFAQEAGPPIPKIGTPAPEFGFSTVVRGGRPASPAALTPASFRGRVVVLDFFATWCGPCVEAIPHTNALIAELKDLPVTFIAVSEEPRETLKAFAVTHPMHSVLAIDAGLTFKNYWIHALPFVVIIDTTGRISAFASPTTLTAEHIRAASKTLGVHHGPPWRSMLSGSVQAQRQPSRD